MKKITYPLMAMFLTVVVLTAGCKKDKEKDSKVDDNGLTAQINNLIPDSILTKMVNLGMTINGGETPPALNGAYLASPFILKASNVPNDYVGYAFADYTVTFYDQNNDDLTIKVDYVNGPESGSGLGGFVVGSDSKFTVFAEVNSEYYGYTAKMVHVVSGTLTGTSIQNLYFANFMLDNNGNLGGLWIANGEGRVIYDSDGSSPKVNAMKSAASGEVTASFGAAAKLR